MQDWQTYYKTHTCMPEEAVRHVQSGMRVALAHAAGEPTVLLDALCAQKERLHNVEICHMVTLGASPHCAPQMHGHLRHHALFIGGRTARIALREGRADFIPAHFSEIPALFATQLPVDVFLTQVSPPDRHGYVSLGVSADYGVGLMETARYVIAQVNPYMPRTHGQVFFPVQAFDAFVEAAVALPERNSCALTPVERTIGQYCAGLIEDGATLQLGIGSLPDAVLHELSDHNDLGIHSEMISDGCVGLIRRGNINNRKKTLHRGQCVASFLMGSRALYDFADDNPIFYMAPVTYVNDPFIIAQNERMVSINSCVQVDLMGQVASESIGLEQISGTGGQLDFIRGARRSRGGKAILAIPSTDKGHSKIVPLLASGATVTTPRTDIQYVVTEYGVADLQGKHLRDRARALIAIAHPDAREGLIEAYRQRFHSSYTPLD